MSIPDDYTRPPPPAGGNELEAPRGRWAWIRDRGSRRAFILAIILLVALGGSWWWSVSNGNGDRAGNESTVSSIPKLDATPGGQIQADSPAYQEALERANDQGVVEAEAAGDSFVATVEDTGGPLDPTGIDTAQETVDDGVDIPPVQVGERPAEEPAGTGGGTDVVLEVPDAAPRNPEEPAEVSGGEVEIVLLQPVPAESESPARPTTLQETPDVGHTPENPMRAMMEAIVSGQRTWQPHARNLAGAGQGNAPAAHHIAQPAPAPAAAAAGREPVIATGTVLTTRMLTTADSDLGSGPAAGEVVTGEHRNTRLTGTWRAAPQGILVQFNTAVAPGRRPVSIDGRGIALDDASPQVSNERESRLLARYGPAFLLGALAAGATSAATERCEEITTITSTGQVVTTSTGCDRPSREEEALFGGLSAGLAAVSADVAANTPRGPRWLLRRGGVIGVLVLAGTDVSRYPQPGAQPPPAIGPAAASAPGVPGVPAAVLPATVAPLLPAAAAFQRGVTQ